jgi:filamentous hemagglutinin family protein
MNKIYRTIWNEKAGNFVAVSELTKSGGKTPSSVSGEVEEAGGVLKAAVAALLLAFGSPLYAMPTDGVVAAGEASISSTAGSMTITQTSQNAALNWQSFSIGETEAVQFVQPNSSSVALNRVLGPDPSSILGTLSANGQVFLVNPNGILFGPGASVNVGGLVASTLNISDGDLMSGDYNFAGTSDAGVLNQGSINADGGFVALLGADVSNQGVIAARLGTVALAAGEVITLDVAGDGLLNVGIDRGAVNALVENGGMIQADGGQVLLSAQSAGHLLHTVVNNTGVIQAQTIENRDGIIHLLGDMQSGTVNVAGTLDASAPDGGDGGFIDTSAATVTVADDTRVTTAAAQGLTGSWLIDPTDYTIAATGGDITGAVLSVNLANTDITIQSISGGSGTAGDVNVNDTVSWSVNKLTLNAQNDININTAMHGSGTASLVLEYGQNAVAAGNTSVVNVRAAIGLPAGANYSTLLGSDGIVTLYTVITELGEAGSTTGTDLQGMNGNTALNYALGSDIDASVTADWNSAAGFAPIGTASAFTGAFDGLGHTIGNLTVNTPDASNVGLFGSANLARFQNIGLINASVSGRTYVGALVGNSAHAYVTNAYSTGTVSGYSYVGGLMGLHNGGTIVKAHSAADVTGTSTLVGGLVGQARFYGTVSDSYATGAVNGSGASYVGGLVGQARFVSLTNTYATGAVTGSAAGGLVGFLDGTTIARSYATGAVTGWGGGLVGQSSGSVSSSYWNVTTSGMETSAGGIGMTTAQMRTPANFTSATAANGMADPGWDLVGDWVVYESFTAPLLRSFMTTLTVTANTASKTYDGLAYSGDNGVTYSTTPNGDLLGVLSYSGTSQGARNAGTYAIIGSGQYSNQQGYVINYVDGTLTVNQADLTLSTTDVSKVYDGALSASGAATVTSGTLFGTDAISGGSFAYTDKNVGAGNKTVITSGVTVTDGNGGSNYNISYVDNTTSTIDPYAVSLTGSRVYDGGMDVAVSALSFGTLIGSETLGLSGTGTVANKHVADGKSVTPGTLALTDGTNGGAASNYTFIGGTQTTDITQAALTLSTGDVSKVYDGDTIASGSAEVSSGTLFGTDTISGGSFAYTDKNAGTGNKTVTTSGVTVADGNAGANYNVRYVDNTSSTVSPKALNVSGMLAADKTYDGNTEAALSGGELVGLVGAETLAFSGQSGAFADSSVGTDKDVSVVGIALSDGSGLAANYSVSNPQGLTADITPIETVTAVDGTRLSGAITSAVSIDSTDDAWAGGSNASDSPSEETSNPNAITGLNLTVAGHGLKSPDGVQLDGAMDERGYLIEIEAIAIVE